MPCNGSLRTAGLLSLVVGLLALVALATAAPAFAAKRVALVIGNSSYRNVVHLQNPANDAKLMAKTLSDLGFTLVGDDAQLDLDKPHFDAALEDFSNQVLGADVALFYYAGHGVQVGGRNFLVPVDSNPTKESDVYLQMVDTSIVLSQMEGSGTKLNIVLLDACRNNPFSGRGLRATGGGLAQMRAPEGTLISYATQPGAAALDGQDGDSPYTKALAQTMRKPGIGLFDTFNEVGVAVKRATGGQQQPWLSSSPIEGGFFFVSAPAAIAIAAATPTMEAPSADAPKRAADANAPPDGASTEKPDSAPKPPQTAPVVINAQTALGAKAASPPSKPASEQQTAALAPNETPQAGKEAETPVAACDRLASAPLDTERLPGVAGVEFESLIAGPAIEACRAALAVEPNNPRIEFQLGRSEMKAGGLDAEAIALFRKAAAAGHGSSMNSLALAYERGAGVPKDLAEAVRWYHRAAETGNSAAIHRLGMAYKNGDGVLMNWSQAFHWFRMSAAAGNIFGMTDLGRAYAQGWGTPADPVEAAKWFRKAADAGGAMGMNHLGLAYLRGMGLQRDPAEAVRWFRKSADAGNTAAMENLGRAYRNGVGVERNEQEAERWFAKARE
jgi:TPR repeat protein